MFTGLIEATGRISGFERQGSAGILCLATTLPLQEIALGDSIAVNGVCLTVTQKAESTICFDVSPESITRTTIGNLRSGDVVNLERALRLGDRLGGHIVSGHIDCIGVLRQRETVSGNAVLGFAMPTAYSRYLVEKGSITIDGISLTVNTVVDDGFSVNIIPHTAEKTTLHSLKTGGRVNLETDILAKYVERLLKPAESAVKSGLTMKTLAENGFL